MNSEMFSLMLALKGGTKDSETFPVIKLLKCRIKSIVLEISKNRVSFSVE